MIKIECEEFPPNGETPANDWQTVYEGADNAPAVKYSKSLSLYRVTLRGLSSEFKAASAPDMSKSGPGRLSRKDEQMTVAATIILAAQQP